MNTTFPGKEPVETFSLGCEGLITCGGCSQPGDLYFDDFLLLLLLLLLLLKKDKHHLLSASNAYIRHHSKHLTWMESQKAGTVVISIHRGWDLASKGLDNARHHPKHFPNFSNTTAT